DLEDADEPEAFEPHHAPRLADLNFTDWSQALAVGVHFAVRFQTCQPSPAERANQLQVFKARVPTIKDDASRRKAPRPRRFEHRLKVVILRQGISLLVEDAIIARNVAVAVRPQKRDQVD